MLKVKKPSYARYIAFNIRLLATHTLTKSNSWEKIKVGFLCFLMQSSGKINYEKHSNIVKLRQIIGYFNVFCKSLLHH
jgi:hypothetical protein